MKKLSIILMAAIILSVLLSGCQSTDFSQSVEIGAEYPVEMFPVYKDAAVYKYEFNEGTIDITFGTKESLEKVSKYYELLFEHVKYDVTAQKLTNQSYISAGKTNHYKYLLEINEAVYRKEKKLYNTVVNLRITINDFVSASPTNDEFSATHTPEPVEKFTPAPTHTAAPTDTPVPTSTPKTINEGEVISTVDIADEQIFIECLGAEEELKGNGQKQLTVTLKIVNYGEEETGYISIADFVMIADDSTAYHSSMTDSIFASGVNIMPGGYLIENITFQVAEDVIPSVLAMPEGLGNRISSSYDLELAPLMPPLDAGAYDEYIKDAADISHIPTFIIGQEYTIDDALNVKLLDAQYFWNHTSSAQDNLMYTFSMEFTNVSEEVIIPAELRDFVLYDIEHNIIIKPTVDLTPYDELAFNPVQNGLSENYHISFEVFEEISENNLCLMLLGINQQENLIIYKIR